MSVTACKASTGRASSGEQSAVRPRKTTLETGILKSDGTIEGTSLAKAVGWLVGAKVEGDSEGAVLSVTVGAELGASEKLGA